MKTAPTVGVGYRDRLWLLGILLVGLAVRLLALDEQSLTNDEIDDLLVARDGADFESLITGARRFPPLYHAILRLWLSILPSDYSARLLSVVLGLALIVVMWWLGRTVAGRLGGIGAAFLTAISPLAIWYSQEVRVYGLVLLVAALALLFFLRALDSSAMSDWAWFAVFGVMGLYVHYYFVVFVLVAVAIVVLRARSPEGIAIPWRIAVIASVCALPSAMLLASDLRGAWGASRDTAFGITGFGYTVASVLTGYTLGPSLRQLHVMGAGKALIQFAPWLLAIGVMLATLGTAGWLVLRRDQAETLGAFIVPPVLVVGVASALGPFGFHPRHVVWIAVPVLLWLGAGFVRVRERPIQIGIVIAILLSTMAVGGRITSDEYRNEDSRAVAAYLVSQDDDAPVYVVAGYMAEPLDYYLEGERLVVGLDDVVDDAQPALAAISSAAGGYWLAVSREFHGDPAGVIERTLLAEGRVTLVGTFAGYRLYRSTSRP